MSWHLFTIFFVSTFFISATPGPNMLLAFQYGLNYGVKRTLWTLAGLSLGLFILLLSTLLGLDVISRQSPWLLEVIKTIGALYLIYLGIISWRDTGNSSLMEDARVVSAEVAADYLNSDNLDRDNLDRDAANPNVGYSNQKPRSLSSAAVNTIPTNLTLFRTGVWVSLSNPKAILFFAAFFPKFINFTAPLWPQYILLTFGLFLSETIWQIIYTLGGKQLAGWLDVGNRLTWLNRACGIIFMLIAAALLLEVISHFL